MKYASYLDPRGQAAFGALSDDGLRLCKLTTPEVPGLKEALSVWGVEELGRRARVASFDVSVATVKWLPPIPQPGKIICVGVNYRAHGEEAGREPPAHPSLFVRFADSLVGHGEPVLVPTVSTQLDFEAELAVVIGRPARYLAPEDCASVIAGYACFAENSVRDFQKHAAQVTAGKNFFASGGWGPCLVSADEVGDLASLRITGRLNGEVMQQDTLGSMIFPVDQIISYISQFTPLSPGDVIATGTPAGVGFLRKPPLFMKAGDRFEVEIASLGVLALPVQQEGPTPP